MLSAAVEQHVALMRACGFLFNEQAALLADYAAFAEACGDTHGRACPRRRSAPEPATAGSGPHPGWTSPSAAVRRHKSLRSGAKPQIWQTPPVRHIESHRRPPRNPVSQPQRRLVSDALLQVVMKALQREGTTPVAGSIGIYGVHGLYCPLCHATILGFSLRNGRQSCKALLYRVSRRPNPASRRTKMPSKQSNPRPDVGRSS